MLTSLEFFCSKTNDFAETGNIKGSAHGVVMTVLQRPPLITVRVQDDARVRGGVWRGAKQCPSRLLSLPLGLLAPPRPASPSSTQLKPAQTQLASCQDVPPVPLVPGARGFVTSPSSLRAPFGPGTIPARLRKLDTGKETYAGL